MSEGGRELLVEVGKENVRNILACRPDYPFIHYPGANSLVPFHKDNFRAKLTTRIKLWCINVLLVVFSFHAFTYPIQFEYIFVFLRCYLTSTDFNILQKSKKYLLFFPISPPHFGFFSILETSCIAISLYFIFHEVFTTLYSIQALHTHPTCP